MLTPTTKELLKDYKAGRRFHAAIPVLPPGELKAGDEVTFQEAIFDAHRRPTLVPGGDSFSVTLTKVEYHGGMYGSSILFAIEWKPSGKP